MSHANLLSVSRKSQALSSSGNFVFSAWNILLLFPRQDASHHAAPDGNVTSSGTLSYPLTQHSSGYLLLSSLHLLLPIHQPYSLHLFAYFSFGGRFSPIEYKGTMAVLFSQYPANLLRNMTEWMSSDSGARLWIQTFSILSKRFPYTNLPYFQRPAQAFVHLCIAMYIFIPQKDYNVVI